MEQLVRPCARIDLGPPTAAPAASRIGGLPYLPAGMPWPVVDGRSAVFVCQVNFTEVPSLPGFPSEGLLQWFVDPGESFGADDDEDIDELVAVPACRWYPGPFDAQSRGINEGAQLPFGIPAGTGLVFSRGRSLPSWDELPADARAEPAWRTVAEAYGDAKARPVRGYSFVRSGDTDHDFELTDASAIGGYVDGPPEGGAGGAQIIIQLDIGHLTGYVDPDADRAGELWGDPGALRTGDLGELRQRWY